MLEIMRLRRCSGRRPGEVCETAAEDNGPYSERREPLGKPTALAFETHFGNDRSAARDSVSGPTAPGRLRKYLRDDGNNGRRS